MAPPDRRPTVGKVDVLEASIGKRGMGKSTWQCHRADQLCREYGGAYVIGHSLGARLPPALPPDLGGRTLPITYHQTIRNLERGLRRSPDRWHVLAPPLSATVRDTADDLLRFAVRFSDSLRKQAWQKAHPFSFWSPTKSMDGIRCTPVIVIIDEGIAIEAAGPSRKEDNRWFLEFLYSLRHYHTVLLYAIQDASARSWRVLEQATVINAFRVTHRWALQSLEAAGASPEEVERIRHQARFQHVELADLDFKNAEMPPATGDDVGA
jgi:hypothetical protein